MTALPSGLAAELGKDVARIFGAIEINFPSGDVRLLDGSAEMMLFGHLFTGDHPVFGSLESIDEFSDGSGDEAPGMIVTLLPAADAAAADVAAEDMQDARVRLWIGAVNEATGEVIAEPYLLSDALIDIPRLELEPDRRSVDYECVSGMEWFFEAEEGIRLAPAFWESVWPGEYGLRHVTGVQDNPYWGQNTPNPGVTNI